MHMGSWGRVLRYDRIRSRHNECMLRRLESQCTGGARESEEVKGGKREGGRINGMCNFARDVPAGVHVHDYRRTGKRE